MTPLAMTRTSASSSFGYGPGTSTIFNTSGAPYSCAITAFTIGLSPAANAPLSQSIVKRLRIRILRKTVPMPVNLDRDHAKGQRLIVVRPLLRQIPSSRTRGEVYLYPVYD